MLLSSRPMVLKAKSLLIRLTGLTVELVAAAVGDRRCRSMLPMMPSFSMTGVSAAAPEVVTAMPMPASTM